MDGLTSLPVCYGWLAAVLRVVRCLVCTDGSPPCPRYGAGEEGQHASASGRARQRLLLGPGRTAGRIPRVRLAGETIVQDGSGVAFGLGSQNLVPRNILNRSI